MTFPTNPTAGQRHQEPSGIWYTWKACATGGAWEQDRAQLTYYDPIPLGAIQAFTIGTAPRGWLLCDGSTFDQTTYPELFAVLGVATLPDLRGEFLRGREAGGVLGAHVDWTTGLPKAGFTTANDGNHAHTYQRAVTQTDAGVNAYPATNNDGGQVATQTTGDASHSHTVTGGDAETAPDHTLVDWYIKAAHAKVTLPQSGFLTATTTLHDGDVWQFDAVSNTFKNVPASTLISGMSVGTAAPTAPFVGQQYYKTDGFTPGLRVWDGTKWAFSSGGNVHNNGSRIIIPGYFSQDPSDTATPGDDIGLAARYYSDHVQLFATKAGAWHRVTPESGVASNAGRVVIADANGEPTWGPYNPINTKWVDSVSNGGTGSWTQDFDPKPRRYIKWDMSGASNANTRLMVIMQVGGGWRNWSADLAEAQCMTHYESGGLREEEAAIKSDWWKDNAGGRITEDNSNYLIKANSTWFCSGSLLISDDRAMFIAVTDYTSDNGTPMKATFRARITHDFRGAINKFGLKFESGSGWFVGHVQGDAG